MHRPPPALLSALAIQLAILALLVFAPLAGAQLATFTGQITNAEGDPIPGVEVEISTLKGPPLVHRGMSNEQGDFRVPLPVQTYDFRYRLSKEGYHVEEGAIEAGRLRTGESTLKQNFVLRLDDGSDGELVQLAEVDENELRGSARAAYNKAAEAFNAEDLDAAEKSFRKALKEDPRLLAAHVALAEIHLRRGELEAAIAETKAALEARPNDRNALIILYDALLLLERREEAEATLERMVRLGELPQLAVRVFNLGVEAMRAGDLAVAVERFEQAVRLDDALLPAREALTNLYLRQERFEDAALQARAILAEDPLNPTGERALEAAERAAEEPAAGEEATEPSSEEASTEVDRAAALLEEGEPEAARELLEAILDREPKNALAHYHLARYHIGAGDSASARRLLERFLKLAPKAHEAERARQLLAVL